jgi:predicted translin family RNA/ssDNA-binding protein
MSDDLIKRLRHKHCCEYVCQCDEAADRIEELERERDRNAAIAIEAIRKATLADEWRDHDKTRAEAAEAKLDKAVEALQEIITRWDTPAWKDVEATGSVINRARTTLAELEGK